MRYRILAVSIIGLSATGCRQLMPMPLGNSPSVNHTASVGIVEKGQSNMYYFGVRGGEASMAQALGLPTKFIECAVPGTDIAAWKPGGTLQTQCTADTADNPASVMLWYQGETDGAECTTNWNEQFTAIVNNERAIHPNIRVIFAQIATTTQTSVYTCWDDIKRQQAAFSMPGVTMVKTDDLLLSSDGLHLAPAGEQELGRRFAEAL